MALKISDERDAIKVGNYDFLTRKKDEQEVKERADKIVVVNGKIGLEANMGDKVILLNDKFKDGNECPSCDGEKIIIQCLCVKRGHPGLNRVGGTCPICYGTYAELEGKTCPSCKGSGLRPGAIIIPESSKTIPTSGIVVSFGPDCKTVQLGERYLYGAHTGYNLPFKGNVRLRILREGEVMCKMHAIDPDASVEDFRLLEEPIDNVSALR